MEGLKSQWLGAAIALAIAFVLWGSSILAALTLLAVLLALIFQQGRDQPLVAGSKRAV